MGIREPATVDLVSVHNCARWQRQPDPKRQESFRFVFNGSPDDAEWLVVYDDLAAALPKSVPRARSILILSEPPGQKVYPSRYLDQFGFVVSPGIALPGRTGVVFGQPALPWMYGLGLDADGTSPAASDLRALRERGPYPNKSPRLSVVLSKKSRLPKHRARLLFVEKLKEALGDRLVIYGRDFEPVDDKATAIDPYKYHLVLENNDLPGFWTEKTADAFLGWSYPIFSGCPDLDRYFPQASFTRIDIGQPEAAIAIIRSVLAEEDKWPERLRAVRLARERLFEEHELFQMLSRLIPTLEAQAAPKAARTVYPTKHFRLGKRLESFAKRLVGRRR